MAKNINTGKKGESLACSWLINQGFEIKHLNWRYSYYEIDIIATRNNILHFIEVKTRTSSAYGMPEQDVSKRKFRFLKNAAVEYMYQNPQWNRIQYDILAILIKNRIPEFYLLEDCYL